MKKLLTLALSLALTATVGAASANTKLTVGASATPHAEILEAAKPILAEKGIDLEIVVFDDSDCRQKGYFRLAKVPFYDNKQLFKLPKKAIPVLPNCQLF